MKFWLLALLCAITIPASAQEWWKFKRHEKLPPLPAAKRLYVKKSELNGIREYIRAHVYTLAPSDFSLEIAETNVMKIAQHNMRFRIYDVASYNFRELAGLFAQQNRLSEAKWYYLQSVFLSRQQNNDKLTVANLMNLGLVKSQIGDFSLAQADLMEARDIARSKGWLQEVIEAEKNLVHIQRNRMASLTDKRYADELTAEN